MNTLLIHFIDKLCVLPLGHSLYCVSSVVSSRLFEIWEILRLSSLYSSTLTTTTERRYSPYSFRPLYSLHLRQLQEYLHRSHHFHQIRKQAMKLLTWKRSKLNYSIKFKTNTSYLFSLNLSLHFSFYLSISFLIHLSLFLRHISTFAQNSPSNTAGDINLLQLVQNWIVSSELECLCIYISKCHHSVTGISINFTSTQHTGLGVNEMLVSPHTRRQTHKVLFFGCW